MNCLEGMKEISDDFIDLTVTSPPYDNLRTYDECSNWNFDVFKEIAKELYRITKPGGVIVWVVGDAVIENSETLTSFKQAIYFKKIGFNIHDTMIYQKSGMAFPSSERYHQSFEYMFVISKDRPKTFNPLKDRKNKWDRKWGKDTKRTKEGDLIDGGRSKFKYDKYGMRFNIWKYSQGGGFGQSDKIAYNHPATFPEELARDHILSWSNENDLVFDPFAGSGTTLVMARQYNRNFLGFEINDEYMKIIEKRLEKYPNKLDEWFDEN